MIIRFIIIIRFICYQINQGGYRLAKYGNTKEICCSGIIMKKSEKFGKNLIYIFLFPLFTDHCNIKKKYSNSYKNMIDPELF